MQSRENLFYHAVKTLVEQKDPDEGLNGPLYKMLLNGQCHAQWECVIFRVSLPEKSDSLLWKLCRSMENGSKKQEAREGIDYSLQIAPQGIHIGKLTVTFVHSKALHKCRGVIGLVKSSIEHRIVREFYRQQSYLFYECLQNLGGHLSQLGSNASMANLWRKISSLFEKVKNLLGLEGLVLIISANRNEPRGNVEACSVPGFLEDFFCSNEVIPLRNMEGGWILPKAVSNDLKQRLNILDLKCSIASSQITRHRGALLIGMYRKDHPLETTQIHALLHLLLAHLVVAYTSSIAIEREKRVSKEMTRHMHLVAHQLIQPLASLQKYLQFLVQPKWRTMLTVERIERYHQYVEGIISMMTQFVYQIAWAVEENGLMESGKSKRVELAPFIMKIVLDLQPWAQEDKNVQLHIEESVEEVSRRVRWCVDETQVRHAIMNVVHNAVKYAYPHTRVTISARVMKKEGKQWLIVDVSDVGVPLRQKDFRKIFKRGYRTKEAVQASPSGTGLGLYVVKKVMDNHKGKIEVNTRRASKRSGMQIEPYQVTFSLWFPLNSVGSKCA